MSKLIKQVAAAIAEYHQDFSEKGLPNWQFHYETASVAVDAIRSPYVGVYVFSKAGDLIGYCHVEFRYFSPIIRNTEQVSIVMDDMIHRWNILISDDVPDIWLRSEFSPDEEKIARLIKDNWSDRKSVVSGGQDNG